VDPRNQGVAAGRYGTLNLGDISQPLHLTPSNVMALLGQMQNILAEEHYWIDGQMFLVVPMAFKMLIQLSPLADASYSGMSDSLLVDGLWPRKLVGFNVYETVHLPNASTAAGQMCYYFIGGHQSAYAYASDIIAARVVRGENTLTTKYQMVCAWGGAMLYPRKIVVAYGYIDTQVSFT
jgi:hypothetical protein